MNPNLAGAEGWLRLGQAQFEAGEYREALESVKRALELNSDLAAALSLKIEILEKLNASIAINEVPKNPADEATRWANQGNQLLDGGRYEEAIACYDKALAIKPDYVVWDGRGTAFWYLQRYEEALASYDRALELSPNSHYVWENRGISLKSLGRYEEEINSYDRALAINSGNPRIWHSRGIALHSLGRHEEAIASYDRALALKPDYDMAWNGRGVALKDLGRHEEAIASYDRALALKPDYDMAWNNRGIALTKLGRHEEAIASYDIALTFKPDDHKTWLNRGNAIKNFRYSYNDNSAFRSLIRNFPNELEQLKVKLFFSVADREIAYPHHIGTFKRQFTQSIHRLKATFNPSYPAVIDTLDPDCPDALIQHLRQPRSPQLYQFIQQPTLPENWAATLSALAPNLPTKTNPDLCQWGYQGALTTYREGLKYCRQDTDPFGWGKLHKAIGDLHRQQNYRRRALADPDEGYHPALRLWRKILLQPDASTALQRKIEEPYLEILETMMTIHRFFREDDQAEIFQQEGQAMLNRILADTSRSRNERIRRFQRFGNFQHLTVDRHIQNGQLPSALETAEKHRNTCMNWLLQALGQNTQTVVNTPTYAQMRQLLDPQTVILYWHLSADTLTTFILRPDFPQPFFCKPASLTPNSQASTPASNIPDAIPPSLQQVFDLNRWIQTWDADYQAYLNLPPPNSPPSHQAPTAEQPETHRWRTDMKLRLQELHQILAIDEINKLIDWSTCQHLILIPHRDLHRFP
ncbi:tetratricopeptide repeat protein, partial [Trichothermofontia sp.]